MPTGKNEIRVVLFDLGGVLVELSGVPIMLQWMGNRTSPEALLKMWLRSPVVRAFETGQITAEEFGDELIAEMVLPVARERLLAEFACWPQRLFPGTLDLLGRIPQRYRRATLSNTNALHWPRLMTEMGLANVFDHHFASHLTGKIKPDEEVFYHVVDKLGCRAEEILFLDDSPLNVEAAGRIGIKAIQVKGTVAAEQALVDFGIVEAKTS
jgi:glucose-1-phosphatase